MESPQAIKVFVVEDDPFYTQFMRHVMEMEPGIDASFFSTGKECLKNLYQNPCVVTLDYMLPDMPGEDVLKAIHEYNPNISVIIVSAQDKIGTAVDLLKSGAYDYITKDNESKNRIIHSMRNAIKQSRLVQQIDRLQQEVGTKYDWSKNIIGSSEAIKQVFSLIEKAIKVNIIVSITGETGTGKEVVAKTIHYHSPRSKQPFVSVNVSAIPKELIESELFGHERGAFTGATNRRIGKFEEASEGTLFLDEIAEMDINLQAKLLRALQEKEITRIGSNQSIKINPRIIVATHQNLKELVQEGRFREDLYYRLLGLPIHLPPLRERGNDIMLLAQSFLDTFSKENHTPKPKISQKACEKLLHYPFPGNVRELKSIIELAAVMCSGNEIEEEHIILHPLPDDSMDMLKEMPLQDYIYAIVRRYLNKYDHNVLEVARRLEIGKSTIYRYLKEMKASS